MGIDRSYYSLKERVNSEIIFGFVSDIFKCISEPELKLLIRSSAKESIQKIKDSLNWEFISCGLIFKTDKPIVAKKEILIYNESLNSLSIGMQHEIEKTKFNFRLNYNKQLKETSASINLPIAQKEIVILQLTNFLNSIHEYIEFGLDSPLDISQFAEKLYTLNTQLSSQHKWTFETGCVSFEPDNYHINRELEQNRYSISGLTVRFAKIHALARKAKGIIDLSMILKRDFGIKNFEYHINFSQKEMLSLILNIPTKEINCYQFYSTKSLHLLNEMEWLIKENDCEIEINNCHFHQGDNHNFNISISGKTFEELNIDLGIDYRASKEYKAKVLNLFKGYMKYDGDS